MAVMTYREALNLALREEMRRDPRVFVIGEEVGLYDGAYKVTQGLLKEFGEQRIVDTPIAESGFTGIGVGAAMLGLRPVVEMMTFNFSILALDQIVNSAAKMLYMSGGQYNIPLVVRGPGGPAAQLAAQHSQSMETYFYHVPGLKVVRPSTPADAKGLLKSAIRDDNPVIFIEAETLYAVKGEVPEDPDFTIPLGKAIVRREGTDITVVAYMGMMYRALEVAEDLAKDGISDRDRRPADARGRWTRETIIGSVRKTHRAVVLEAGAGFAGMGSEISAFITENAFDDLDAPVERVTGENAPMPYARNLELLKTPSKAKIAAAIRRVVRGMITKVLMPKLSEAMETGKVIQWLKKEGDTIKGGDVIAEIETDKANVEVEAFGSGVLRKILVGPGGTVPVGEMIGVIADPADDVSGLAAAPSKPAAARGRRRPPQRQPPSPQHGRPRPGTGRCARGSRPPAPPAAPHLAQAGAAAAVPAMETYQSTPATTERRADDARTGRLRRGPGDRRARARRPRWPARSPRSRASICISCRAAVRAAASCGATSRRHRRRGRRPRRRPPRPRRPAGGRAAPFAIPPRHRRGVRGRGAHADARDHRQADAAVEGAGPALLRHHRGGDGPRHGSAGGAERGSKASPRSR